MYFLYELALNLDSYIFQILTLTAIVGAVLAAITREDAFRAGDRQGKWVWVGLLAGSAVAMATGMLFLSWIGTVITGVYWFDVRPQLKAIINGDYSY
ncbi:DUF2516 family protein [Corynebacterium sp. MSK105]|uniref:DUF2516 family protein n=1 Tax=unclassified Corynebacterium TaxID=2624378 RepID=UPI00254B588E|nr:MULTISPECIES: DUF2516 family protein [unclassified Corynebacterium]MDK8482510.1 DUF2516 family protein [Corynebacterium sp. MSK074]MDK8689946.1 DUF2516 family protein [Corynebacterium sp. MSK105]